MSESVQTVLVTGAAGFVGSRLTERCLERGWNVVAIDSFTDYYDPDLKRQNCAASREHDRCRFVDGDLLDLDLESLLGGVDVVFHLAAQPGVRASWGDGFGTYSRQNIEAFQRLLESATHHSLHRFVFASSSSVYGNAETLPTIESTVPQPVSPYGMTKVAGEQLAAVYFRNHALPVVGLRYFTVFGPRQRPDMAFNRLITAVLTGEEFRVYGDGEQTRDFTFVDDAVAGTIGAGLSGRPGGVYNLGGGSRVSMREVFATLEAVAGMPVRLRFESAQRGDARDTSADISAARRDFGYAPEVPLDEGLRRQLEWQRASARTGSREVLRQS
jgi:UDP-glucose 4-epimerase